MPIILYKGKYQTKNIEFTRVWAMPSPWTFSIYPVAQLVKKYIGDGSGWVDPFSGKSKLAEFRNDNNPERLNSPQMKTMEAIDYVKTLNGRYNGVLYDPPYSFLQLKKHYAKIGKKFGIEHARMGFYEKVKSVMCSKVKKGGYAISFGWNTNGFGKTRGFQIIEIMTIAHGGSRNDTIITVEVKK